MLGPLLPFLCAQQGCTGNRPCSHPSGTDAITSPVTDTVARQGGEQVVGLEGSLPPLPKSLSTQGANYWSEFPLARLLLSFLPPVSKLLGGRSCLCPQGSSKGPILSCRSDGSNSINGKQDKW